MTFTDGSHARLRAGQGEPGPPQRHRPADQRHASARAAPARSPTSPRPTPRPSSSPGQAAGPGARTTWPTRPASSSASPTRSPTRKTLATTPDGSGPYTLNDGETTRGSTYTLEKNDKAWNADDWSVRHDRLQDHHRPAGAGQRGRLRSGRRRRPAGPDHRRPGRVQAERRELGGTIVGFPVFDKTGSINPAFARTPRCGWPSATASTARRSSRTCTRRPGRPRSSSRRTPHGFDPALDTQYAYDPDKAKQLLADAGHPNGFEIDITVLRPAHRPTSSPSRTSGRRSASR